GRRAREARRGRRPAPQDRRGAGAAGPDVMTLQVARRVGLSIAFVVGLVVCLILGLAVVTARSGDRTLWPVAPEGRTIEVFVVNHGYHSGIVVPRAAIAGLAGERDIGTLGHIAVRFDAHDWLEIGWGDEEFYTQV